MKTVTVEVWSDFVCPWCWIAKRRLEQAIDSLAGQVDVKIQNNAYRLAKNLPPMDYSTALKQKLGSAEAASRLMNAVSDAAATVGLKYSFSDMRFGDTTLAHSLVKSIKSQACASDILERIYRAATTDSVDIFERTNLNSIALAAGFDASALDLEAGNLQLAVANDEARANSIANGVPLFLFNNKMFISGAREPDVFREALLESAIHKPSPQEINQAQSCSIDGCAS